MNPNNEELNNKGASPSDMNTAPDIMAPSTGVVYQANVIPAVIPVAVNQMGPKESTITCPSCNQQIVTKVEYKATTKTHLYAALLCILGGCLCAFIPYCVKSCRNANHYCPNCDAYIGSYNH